MKASDFSRFLTQYLTHYLPVQRNLSSNTIRSYRDTFKLLLIFCRDEKGFNIAKLNLAMLDKKCIEDFLLWLTNTRGSSPSTYNQRLCAIHAFFDYVMIEEPTWREMLWIQKDSVLCVAASDFYDPADYIRNYEDFKKYLKELNR